MFTFLRTATGQTEMWEILLLEGSRPDCEKRFGPALRHEGTEPSPDQPLRFHEIGVLAVLHQDSGAELVVGGKNGLTDDERRTLDFQIEALVGAHVHDGDEPTPGWYWHDTLTR